jgi:homopolymeric O-antigen transport system permease protein
MPTESAGLAQEERPTGAGANRLSVPHGLRAEALVAYWELLSNLVARELKTKYRGSALGIFWSLLNPLILMLVYTVVFSVIVRVNIRPYPIFLLAGLVPWNAFAQTLTSATTSVTDNAGIVRKVYFPLEILPLSAVFSASVHLLISLGLLAVLVMIFHVGIGFSLLFLPLLLALQVLFSVGLGSLLAAGQVYFRDVQYFLSVLITVWFFTTPIVYSLDLVPERFRPFFEANPMAWLVASYQDIWFYKRPPGLLHFVGFATAATLLALIGLVSYHRLSRRFAEEV